MKKMFCRVVATLLIASAITSCATNSISENESEFIKEKIISNTPAFHACAMQGYGKSHGKLILEFEIRKDGSVREVVATNSKSDGFDKGNLSDDTIACIVKRVEEMRFPPLVGKSLINVKYPLVFINTK